MKRLTHILLFALLIPAIGIGQTKSAFIDDIYFNASDVSTIKKTTEKKQIPNYKNGAKEIIFKENEDSKTDNYTDSVKLLAQANDSTEEYNKQGEYLYGFKGNQSDLEYAERIRRFHNPKYTVFIGDPSYNDIYFLNSSDWNVYVEGPYAYVTPTWTNPLWWDYSFSPLGYGFGYGGWGHSPYSYYGGWNRYPWSFNSYYGFGGYGAYYGYGGYYGYGNYYGYSPYYDYYGYGMNYRERNPNHNEGYRRELSSGINRTGNSSGVQSRTSGGNYQTLSNSPYTRISGIGSRGSLPENGTQNLRSANQNNATINATNTIGTRSIPTNSYRTGLERTNSVNRNNPALSGSNTISRTATPTFNNRTNTTINTQPRTTPNTTNRATYSTQTPTRSSYSTSGTTRSSTPTYNSGGSRSSGTYSTPSSGGSSYSGGSSSSGSAGSSTRSSGSSGGSRR